MLRTQLAAQAVLPAFEYFPFIYNEVWWEKVELILGLEKIQDSGKGKLVLSRKA